MIEFIRTLTIYYFLNGRFLREPCFVTTDSLILKLQSILIILLSTFLKIGFPAHFWDLTVDLLVMGLLEVDLALKILCCLVYSMRFSLEAHFLTTRQM